MRYFVTYLIYIAVLARAAGWSQDSWPIPTRVWVLLALFGVLLFSEQALTRRFSWYPRPYILVQSLLVMLMMYLSPGLDILSMLLFSLSFQAVWYYPTLFGFIWIGVYSLAMLGLFLVGLEADPGISMVVSGSAANLLMGSFALLMKRTEDRRQENQRLFTDLQTAYRQLKDSAVQAEALAAAEERHRLVRELHDSLTQTLFSMNLAVQAAQLAAQDAPQEIDEHLVRLQALSHSAVSEVQALTGQAPLYTPAQVGLETALRQLAEERLAQDGLQVQIEVIGKRQLSEAVQAAVYRIAHEALNNVTRHAGVRQALVRLQLDPPRASLEVTDAGCGFDPGEVGLSGGFGLGGMRSRAEEIGWQLDVRSQPGQGTAIRVEEQVA